MDGESLTMGMESCSPEERSTMIDANRQAFLDLERKLNGDDDDESRMFHPSLLSRAEVDSVARWDHFKAIVCHPSSRISQCTERC
jgi:hypothetical protein